MTINRPLTTEPPSGAPRSGVFGTTLRAGLGAAIRVGGRYVETSPQASSS